MLGERRKGGGQVIESLQCSRAPLSHLLDPQVLERLVVRLLALLHLLEKGLLEVEAPREQLVDLALLRV
jgi:hypothetical protein